MVLFSQAKIYWCSYLYDIPEGKEPTNLERREETVTVTNLHDLAAKERPSLQSNGIQLCKMRVPDGIDWNNQEEVKHCL